MTARRAVGGGAGPDGSPARRPPGPASPSNPNFTRPSSSGEPVTAAEAAVLCDRLLAADVDPAWVAALRTHGRARLRPQPAWQALRAGWPLALAGDQVTEALLERVASRREVGAGLLSPLRYASGIPALSELAFRAIADLRGDAGVPLVSPHAVGFEGAVDQVRAVLAPLGLDPGPWPWKRPPEAR